MINQFKETFTLDNFEGPLDFLLHLIQKNEIEIKDISIADIIDQFLLKWKEQLDKQIDSKSEFISHASFLLWLKSKSLLPRSEEESLEDQEMDPHFEIIHQLIEYCHIKQAAKGLALLEQKQNSFFYRSQEVPEIKKPIGIEHLSLEDFSNLFKNLLAKASKETKTIREEVWQVADKIKFIKNKLVQENSLPFSLFFSIHMSKQELIVTFLAVLELMKIGILSVVKTQDNLCIIKN